MIRSDTRFTICALAILFTLSVASAALSQVVTGAILGRVTDSTGAVVPGATLQIQNVETGFSRAEQTDREGRYLARNLPLGTYSVTVQQPGFSTKVQSGIVLTVASEVTVNVELAVGNVQEKVEVTAEAPLVETTNATLSGLVSQDQLRDLPLNGRSVDQLALLSPGVFQNQNTTRNATVGVGIHLSIDGARPDSTLYLLDGTVVNDSTNNGHGSAAGQALGVESILEFRLLSHNFTAEYGRNGGGVISAVTRSGTNELHGSVYEFVRNNIFDARNFFNPGALPAFRRNQFGAAAGGRIIKDRLFFFANYEGLRQRQGNTIISSVPDTNARLGSLPNAAGALQPVTLNPAATPYVNLYPLANGREHGDGTADSIANFSAPTTEDYAMERMDFRMSDKDSFYWRYVFDPSQSVGNEAVPTFVTPIVGTDHLVVLSETHVFSGASLNEFRFAFNRTAPGSDSHPATPLSPSLSFVPGQTFGTVSYTSGGGTGVQLSTLGANMGATNKGNQNVFEETDTYSIVRGAHSLKFGIDLERQQINDAISTALRGNYQFGGVQSLLAAQPTQFTFLLLGPNSTNRRGWRRVLFSGFAQDDYRVRPNLTLNLGLRYEYFNTPSEVNGLMSSLRNITDPTNTPGPPFQPGKANFAPRAGLAWDPTGSGKTSVRMGAGVFYNQLDGRTWFNDANNSDFTKSYVLKSPPFPNALAAGLPVGALQQNLQVVFNAATPTVIQYNLEVQRQLAPTVSLRAAYVGSHGYNLAVQTQQDLRIPQILPDGSKFFATTAPYINPNFSTIPQLVTSGHSNYNALQTVLQKTFSAGLTFQAAYTYSKDYSDADEVIGGQIGSATSVPMDPNNLGRDYSYSNYDERHKMVLSGAYLMPWDKHLNGKLEKSALGGWAINGIYSYGTGLPLDIQTGFNNSQDGDTTAPDRPNLAPGASTNPNNGVTAGCGGIIPAGQQLHTPTRWFDPCAFVLPAAGFYGNLGRNTVTGPGFNNFDFTLVKDTTLTEKKKLEFRAEFFNIFNHANFAVPVISVFNSSRTYNGNSGQITSTTAANRQIQLGLKFMF